ncbi:MAG: hemolysin family protein [Chloroflexota bacterium]|nr:hemolysin family protein [Chloroflexota bacterium]
MPARRSPTLDADTSAGLLLLFFALTMLAVVSAAEAGVASASRAQLRAAGGKGHVRSQRLHGYITERASTLGSLAVARSLAVVLATALGIFLITRERGHTWAALIVVSAGVLIVVALLDALPRLIVARHAERWGVRLVPVIWLFRMLFGPLASAIDHGFASVVRNGADAPDELLRLAEIETDGEPIEEEERQMIRGIIEMEDTTVREIMAPRIDIVALDVSQTIDDALKLVVEKGFSRIPLYNDTIDDIVGIVYAKDLLRCTTENERPPLAEIARPPYFIPESKRVDELLTELRKSKVHIAIIADEYGGTAGLVTIEDLLEEIVGEIQDEYDREEAPIERVNETEVILDARVSIDALGELFGFEVDEAQQEYDTVGGFVYHHLGKVPIAGDEVRVDGLSLRVLSVLGRRIKKIRATKLPPPEGVAAVS